MDGHTHTVSLSVEAVRQAAVKRGSNLSGRWRATLALRTRSDASLTPRLFLRRVRTVAADLPAQPTFWACTGDVIGVDFEAGLLEVHVPSRGGRGDGFSVHARVSTALLEVAAAAKYVHVTGTLHEGRLLAERLEARDVVQLGRAGHLTIDPSSGNG